MSACGHSCGWRFQSRQTLCGAAFVVLEAAHPRPRHFNYPHYPHCPYDMIRRCVGGLVREGHNYGLVYHALVLRALLYLLAVANRRLIIAADRLYVVIVIVFVFLLFLLALLLFYRLFPQSFFTRNTSDFCIILTFLVHQIAVGVSAVEGGDPSTSSEVCRGSSSISQTLPRSHDPPTLSCRGL